MIFAPFTGMDNHGRPVNFAAGLLSNEDAASFSWLFNKFVDCMGAPPSLIITDQDLGMKAAIERVLVGTRHRWCMWHIMLKLAEKVSKELHANELFKKDLNSYVWSEINEPEVFEEGWHCTMHTYGLVGDDWFETMYKARQYWVPSYFRDFPMSGLVRTTSISESENSFFKRYTRSRSNLVEFWMNFNHALEAQRNASSHQNYIDKTILPTMETIMRFEKHAGVLYSTEMFRVVQEEIVSACNNCELLEILNGETEVEYKIQDEFGQICRVKHDIDDETFVCRCKLFVRKGILCRHIFLVFKNRRLKTIPEKYVIGRWRKIDDVTPVHEIQITDCIQFVGASESQQLKNKIMSSMFGWMQVIDGNIEQLTSFLTAVNDAGECVTGQTTQSIISNKKRAFEKFYDAKVPENIEVLPPDVVKTKGSGSRLKSRQEKAAKLLLKPKRRCGKCKEMTHHDSRNCDKVANKATK